MSRTWLDKVHKKFGVYCSSVWSIQCYEAGDGVVHGHMYGSYAGMPKAHCLAALVCSLSRALNTCSRHLHLRSATHVPHPVNMFVCKEMTARVFFHAVTELQV